MELISHEINSNNISLVTDKTVTGLVLSYGDQKFIEHYDRLNINNNAVTITKEDLGLANLDNRYFKIELYGTSGKIEESFGAYHINIENARQTPLYNAAVLKQELDNLNYYDGIMQSLNEKKLFPEANDFFFNYKQFLEKKLNGNNILSIVSGQNATCTKSK